MKVFLSIILLFVAMRGFSQVTPGLDTSGVEIKTDTVIERLVAMAYENYRLKILESTAISAEYEWRRSKTAILNNILSLIHI